MGAAPADEGEVGGIDREPMSSRHGLGETLKIVERDVDREPTDLTGEVMVLDMIGEGKHRRAVAQMDVVYQSRLLESVDRAIDRRNVDRRSEHLLGRGVQRRRSEMQIVTPSESATDGTSRCRHSEAIGSQGVEQLAGFDVGHGNSAGELVASPHHPTKHVGCSPGVDRRGGEPGGLDEAFCEARHHQTGRGIDDSRIPFGSLLT